MSTVKGVTVIYVSKDKATNDEKKSFQSSDFMFKFSCIIIDKLKSSKFLTRAVVWMNICSTML